MACERPQFSMRPCLVDCGMPPSPAAHMREDEDPPVFRMSSSRAASDTPLFGVERSKAARSLAASEIRCWFWRGSPRRGARFSSAGLGTHRAHQRNLT
jgi:hypothetical protein